MKLFAEGVIITAIFWFAAIMDGNLDGIEPIKQFRTDFDMALYWAIGNLVEYL